MSKYEASAWRKSLWIGGTLMAAAMALVLTLPGGETAQAQAGFELKGNAANGKAVFTKYCATCHGDSGKGDGAAGVALTPKPSDFTRADLGKVADQQLYNTVKNGGVSVGKSPLMVAWGGTLKDQEIRDVVAYVRSFHGK